MARNTHHTGQNTSFTMNQITSTTFLRNVRTDLLNDLMDCMHVQLLIGLDSAMHAQNEPLD